jgi:undecaprenyl-diphosphatase
LGITWTITRFGDAVILLPASAALAGYLLLRGERRTALAWIVALGTGLALLVASKLFLMSCTGVPSRYDSPSGHTGFAAIFYGGAALIVSAGRPLWQQRLVLAGSALLVLAIGASRIRLGAHTYPEVAIGLAIGVAAFALFASLKGPDVERPPLAWRPLALVFLAGLVLTWGRHLGAEERIRAVAARLEPAPLLCEAAARSTTAVSALIQQHEEDRAQRSR